MKRWRWTVRLRTTTKQVTGEEAQLTKEPFQAFFAAMFYTKHHCLIYNCDETSVYLDALARGPWSGWGPRLLRSAPGDMSWTVS